MASNPLLKKTFGSLVGLRDRVMGVNPERRERRNEFVAHIAYGLAYCDGQVHPLEREALALVVLKDYPWMDQADILAYFDRFRHEEATRTTTVFLTSDVVTTLPEVLFAEDYEILPRLMARIAEAHEGVLPAEQQLMQKVNAVLSAAQAQAAQQPAS